MGDLDDIHRLRSQQHDLYPGVVPVLLLALAVSLERRSNITEFFEAELLARVVVKGDKEL